MPCPALDFIIAAWFISMDFSPMETYAPQR